MEQFSEATYLLNKDRKMPLIYSSNLSKNNFNVQRSEHIVGDLDIISDNNRYKNINHPSKRGISRMRHLQNTFPQE
jgi:hypothetical protein